MINFKYVVVIFLCFSSLLCTKKNMFSWKKNCQGIFTLKSKRNILINVWREKNSLFLKNVVFGISFCTQKKDINQSVNQSINYKQYNINVYTFFLSYPSENLSRQIIFSSAAVMHVCVRYMDLYLVQENYSIIIYKNFSFYISLFYLQLSTDQRS